MSEKPIAQAQRFLLEIGTVTRDQEPVRHLVAEQLDAPNGREVSAELRVCGVGGFGKNKPYAVVLRRLRAVAKYADQLVVNVDRETGKERAHVRVQRSECFQNEGVRPVESFLGGVKAGFAVHVPADVDVTQIRTKLHMTQARFSDAFGFSLDAIKHWERGRRTLEVAARAYLTVIAREPEAVVRALGRNVTQKKRAA